jgi:hypothetical protein
LYSSANLVIGNDPTGNESGDLPYQHLAARGLEPNRCLFVVQAGLFGSCMAEFARVVVPVRYSPLTWIPVYVNVKDIHEDRNPTGAAGEECRLVGLEDAHHLPIGGRQDQAITAQPVSDRVTEKSHHPDRQDDPDDAQDPQEARVKS